MEIHKIDPRPAHLSTLFMAREIAVGTPGAAGVVQAPNQITTEITPVTKPS
jgi:hypothetical protein